ncbi:MAG: UDP-N-acetylmuramate dehydrogenase [Candidatus Nanopelagicales bacterium]|nr:UDP-N-acetylmuramate dehydrogenase [Candidatus Nanopelagicales bacterium]
MTTLRCGGPARELVTATTVDTAVSVVSDCDDRREPVLLLGGGSNVVIADDGFPGTVVRMATGGVEVTDTDRNGDDSVRLVVAAGETWDRVVARSVDDQLTGLEFLSGIPGSVGAAPVQNIGAYGAELSSVLETVAAFDRRDRQLVDLGPAECGFEYRMSRFKRERGRWLITQVTLMLRRVTSPDDMAEITHPDLVNRLGVAKGERVSPRNIRQAVLMVRRSKGMVLDVADHDTWSVGSFFLNPVVASDVARRLPVDAPYRPVDGGRVRVSAAWLIEASGIEKGWGVREDAAARISTRHSLALTNRGGATTADILELARAVIAAVQERFGITLEPEPNLVGCSL